MTIRMRPSYLQERFGYLLKRLREERRLTRSQLAKKANLSPSYIGALEYGDNMPTLGVIVTLAQVLGVSPVDIVREVTTTRPVLPPSSGED